MREGQVTRNLRRIVFYLPALEPNEIGVTPRIDRMPINWTQPLYFPEFEGKFFCDEMPFIYSFVYTASPRLFGRQLARLRKMPARFQEWYGDQVTLKQELASPIFVRRDFDIRIYNRSVKTPGELDLALGGEPQACIVHFKGRRAKELVSALLGEVHAGAAPATRGRSRPGFNA